MPTKNLPRIFRRNPLSPDRCAASVTHGGYIDYQCMAPGKVAFGDQAYAAIVRDKAGQLIGHRFCGSHDPSKVAARILAKSAADQVDARAFFKARDLAEKRLDALRERCLKAGAGPEVSLGRPFSNRPEDPEGTRVQTNELLLEQLLETIERLRG